MRLSRCLGLIAALVGMGVLQVSQRNAIVLKGYAVSEGVQGVHAKETDASWLTMEVTRLLSPTHLAHVEQERRLELVARPTLSPGASPAGPALMTADAERAGAQPLRLATRDEVAD